MHVQKSFVGHSEPYPEPAWRALMSAVILQALRDAIGGKPFEAREARNWLGSLYCGLFLDALNIEGVNPVELLDAGVIPSLFHAGRTGKGRGEE